MGVVLLAATCLAGIHPEREPLPSREVERPAVLPLGWSEVGATVGAGGYGVAARHGFARGLDASAALSSDDLRVGGQVSLVWREPPALGWTAGAAWVEPLEGDPRAELTTAIRHAFGPIRAEGAAGVAIAADGASPLASGAVLAQIGFLWVEGRIERVEGAEGVPSASLVAQLTRGVSLGAGVRGGWWSARAVVWL